MADLHSNKSVVMIAGEVSGDIHGSRLIASLKSIDPLLQVHGIGGDLMIKEGLEPVYHIEQMAFLGVGEIIKHLQGLSSSAADANSWSGGSVISYR